MRNGSGFLGDTSTFQTLSTLFTNCMHWLLYLYYRHGILLASHSHSPSSLVGLAPVCPVTCFQRRSSRQCHSWWQQKVIIYLEYWVHGDGILAFFHSCLVALMPHNITSDPWQLLSFITTEKRNVHGQEPVDSWFSVSSVSCDEGCDSKDQFR